MDKKSGKSLIKRPNHQLSRVGNLIALTNKLLDNRTITQEDWDWWDGLEDIWKKIFNAHVFDLEEKCDWCGGNCGKAILNFGITTRPHLYKFKGILELKKIFYTPCVHGWKYYSPIKDYYFLKLSDVLPILRLTQLTELDLSGNEITDVSLLSNFTQLRKLDLKDNEISDISPLSNLSQLTELDLYGNNIIDITPLSNLTELKKIRFI